MDRREIRPGLAEVRDQTPAQKPFDRLTRLGVPPVDELRLVGPALSIHWGRPVEPGLKAGGLGFVPDEHICLWSLCVWSCDMSFRPRDLADRMAGRRDPDGYVWETFSLPREQARAKAKAFLRSYPPT
jgi:hypothetical protein